MKMIFGEGVEREREKEMINSVSECNWDREL